MGYRNGQWYPHDFGLPGTEDVRNITTVVPDQVRQFSPDQRTQADANRRAITAEVLRASGFKTALDASGTVREVPVRVVDDRLAAALAGRVPASKEQLDAWLKESDATLGTDQRMALTFQYEQAHGRLPSVQETPAEARLHSLASLGVRPGTRLTEAELGRRMRAQGVPGHLQIGLAVEAAAAGHLVREPPQPRPGRSFTGTTDVFAERARRIAAEFEADLAAHKACYGRR